MFRKNLLSKIICLSLLVTFIWVTFNLNRWKNCGVLSWDTSCYFAYLPATFIYHDICYLKFYDHVDSVYHPTGSSRRYAIFQHPETKRSYIKYSCGVALFEMPLYLVAQAYCSITGSYPLDGYSAPFQLSVSLSTVMFSFLGLLFLRKFLLKYFSDRATAIALIITGYGTNLFVYSAIDDGMSHVFLFFLYCVILLYTYKWYKSPTYTYSAILGLAIGMAFLTRPTDIMVAIIPITWGIIRQNKEDRVYKDYFKEWKKIMVAMVCVVIPLIPQLLYWKATTGSWVYYSYTGERFDFTDPQIMNGLFSYRKGWFVYTPLAVLGFIGLFFNAKKLNQKFYILPFLLFIIPTIYVLFSWECWYYGGSFGCRVLIQSLALLAFPIASLSEYMMRNWKTFTLYSLIVLSGVTLSLFQQWQYCNSIIHWDAMNKVYYWRVFGKTNTTEEDRKLLKQ